MKFINNILFIEFQEAVKASISPRTLKSWSNPLKVSDPSDRRKVLIRYETLKEKYKALITAEFGNPYAYANNQSITSSPFFKLTASDKHIIDTYTLDDGRTLPTDYIDRYYQSCRYLQLLTSVTKRNIKQLGYPSTADFKQAVASLIKVDTLCKLPSSRTRLDSTVRGYKTEGALYLIKKDAWRFTNANSTKINKQIADYLIGLYALPTKMSYTSVLTTYTKEKVVKEAAPMLTEQAIRYFLNKPEVKPIWLLSRTGMQHYKKQVQHHLKLRKASFANAFWVIDGTKLDVYYQTKETVNNKAEKKIARLKINVIMDAYSEKIIGWHVSESEKHIDHYKAFKMAVKDTQVKPFQIAYDGQSGHTSGMMQSFYDKLVAHGGTHYKSRPYSSQGKPIEQMFNRFQKQVLQEYWFCDGQSPLSKRNDSVVNPSFVSGEKDTAAFKEKIKALFPDYSDRLPYKEDIIEKYVPKMVADWNAAKHPNSNQSRLERFEKSENPKEEVIGFLDMVRLFWLVTSRPSTYYKGGITLTLGGKDYEYEVYDENNNIDTRFRKRNLGLKFFIQYDPEDLSEIRLLEKTANGYQFIAAAATKRTHTQVLADMVEGDKQAWHKDFKVRDQELEQALNEIARIRSTTGITPEKLIEDAEQVLKDGAYASKDRRSHAESTASLLNQL